MAVGRVAYAEVSLPVVPVGLASYAEVAIPGAVVGLVSWAEVSMPTPPTAVGRVAYAEVSLPAPPGMPPPSGVAQLTSTGAWWNATLRQRTAAGEWI